VGGFQKFQHPHVLVAVPIVLIAHKCVCSVRAFGEWEWEWAWQLGAEVEQPVEGWAEGSGEPQPATHCSCYCCSFRRKSGAACSNFSQCKNCIAFLAATATATATAVF